jgi:hypothetical protein
MKQRPKVLPGSLPLLALCGALACGGDDGGGGSGVDGKKLISDLKDADAKKVCEWMEKETSSIAPTTKQVCTAAAVSASSTPTECNQLVAQCLKSAPDTDTRTGGDDSDCSDADTSDVDTSCHTVTVGEFEACFRAYMSAFQHQLASISCANAGKEIEFDSVTTPDACKKVVHDCPSLLSDIEDDTVSGDTGGNSGGGSSSEIFSCGGGEMIPGDWVCDAEEDCSNGKDEEGC